MLPIDAYFHMTPLVRYESVKADLALTLLCCLCVFHQCSSYEHFIFGTLSPHWAKRSPCQGKESHFYDVISNLRERREWGGKKRLSWNLQSQHTNLWWSRCPCHRGAMNSWGPWLLSHLLSCSKICSTWRNTALDSCGNILIEWVEITKELEKCLKNDQLCLCRKGQGTPLCVSVFSDWGRLLRVLCECYKI